MGQVLHGSARTTPAVRRLIQPSPESLATRHGINPKPASTVLTAAQEAVAVAFRQHTQLPPDDCLDALQETLPELSRPAPHRLFQRHGISRLPAEKKKKSNDYPIGCLCVGFAEVHTEARGVCLICGHLPHGQGSLRRQLKLRNKEPKLGRRALTGQLATRAVFFLRAAKMTKGASFSLLGRK